MITRERIRGELSVSRGVKALAGLWPGGRTSEEEEEGGDDDEEEEAGELDVAEEDIDLGGKMEEDCEMPG